MKKPSQNELLKAAIDDSGLTVTEVAARAGYARGYKEIYPYLTGERVMGPKVQERLTRALLLPPDYFDPLRPAAVELRSFLASAEGKAISQREREALRKILPYLSGPSAENFRLLVFVLRSPAPTQKPTLPNGSKRGKA